MAKKASKAGKARFSRRGTRPSKHRRLSSPHRSFRRSYREDYLRQNDPQPPLFAHAAATLKVLAKNWRIFGALFLVIVATSIILLGLLSEDTYVRFQTAIDETSESMQAGDIGRGMKAGLLLVSSFTSGGLSQTMSETQRVLTVFVFLTVWLTTIFILRQLLLGNRLKMRDALYSALSPLVSTLIIFVIIFVQLIPIFLSIFAYSVATATDFLATPFYAFIFWLLSLGLTLLSAYFLSSSAIALIFAALPRTRPLAALQLASELMTGRRLKFLLRLVFLIFLLLLGLVAIIFPIILLDLALKSAFTWLAGWPIVPVALLLFTIFFFIYATAYVYLYYRKLIDHDSD